MLVTVDPWDAQYRKLRGLRWYPSEELIRFIGGRYGIWPFERLDPLPGTPVVLDLGCGAGANAWFLHYQGFEVAILDSSVAAIKLALARVPDAALKKVHRLPEPLTFEDGMFDGVVDCQTMQHLRWSEHLPVYQEIARVLKPGGWLFSMHLGPASTDWTSWAMREQEHADLYTLHDVPAQDRPPFPLAVFPGNGITCYPPADQLRMYLRLAGLEGKDDYEVTRTYHNGWAKAQWWVVVAEKPI